MNAGQGNEFIVGKRRDLVASFLRFVSSRAPSRLNPNRGLLSRINRRMSTNKVKGSAEGIQSGNFTSNVHLRDLCVSDRGLLSGLTVE
jgi:hypothetical protein